MRTEEEKNPKLAIGREKESARWERERHSPLGRRRNSKEREKGSCRLLLKRERPSTILERGKRLLQARERKRGHTTTHGKRGSCHQLEGGKSLRHSFMFLKSRGQKSEAMPCLCWERGRPQPLLLRERERKFCLFKREREHGDVAHICMIKIPQWSLISPLFRD